MHSFRRGIRTAALTCCGALLLAAPAAAQDVSVYHPDAESRHFTTTPGGWTSSSSSDGACVPVLLCPAVTNSYEATGGRGTAPDGHLRTETSGAAGVAGNVTGVWESPAFIYNGAQGKVPTRLEVVIARRADIGDFLDAGGTDVRYSVEIIDDTTGDVAAAAIDGQSVGPTSGFIPITEAMEPALLARGTAYRIRVSTRFVFGTTLAPAATVDYDDIGLAAFAAGEGEQGPPGPPGPRGPQGPPGGDGDDGKFDIPFLHSFIQNNTRDWKGIRVRNGRGLVLVRCPGRARQAGNACRFTLTAMWKRRGPAATGTRTVSIRPRGKRVVKLPIRGRFRQRILNRRQILVRYRVRVGQMNATVWKQLRPVDCRRAAVC